MQTLKESLKYHQWLKALENNNISVSEVRPLHLVHKENGELLFGFVHAEAQAPNGEKLLPVALIRGHFVSIVTVLIEQETKRRYLLLVRQYRIANGEYSYEHPAGMCDNNTDPFAVAVKEIAEETGLEVQKEQLRLLNDTLLYSSPGLLDEGGYLFSCEIELSASEIDSFRGKQTGAEGEREFISTFVCPIEEAMPLMSSITARLNLMMYLYPQTL